MIRTCYICGQTLNHLSYIQEHYIDKLVCSECGRKQLQEVLNRHDKELNSLNKCIDNRRNKWNIN